MSILDRKRAIRFSVLVLFLTSFAIAFPVIRQPYWGMFSDYLQIVESCRAGIPHGIVSCLADCCFDLRPGAHIPDYLTWFFFPEQPRAFYIEHWLVFFLTLVLTFFSSLRLSQSVPISLLSTVAFLFAKPTFEVLYTLDKGEIFIAFMFSFIVWLNVSTSQNSRTLLFARVCLALLVSCYAMFTKQTAQLLVVYAFLSLGCAKLPRRVSVNKPEQRELLWFSAFLFISVTSWAAFHLFYRMKGGFSIPRYNEMDYGLTSAQRLFHYVLGIPELSIALITTLVLLLLLLRDKSKSDSSEFRQCAALTITVGTGAIALSGWPSEICYIFYPLLSFLLPALAYVLANAPRTLRWLVGVIAISLVIQIPFRFEDAQEQHEMDRLFFELKSKLEAIRSDVHSEATVVLPFTDKNAFEIGNTLRAALEHGKPTSLKVANIIRFQAPTSDSALGEFKCPEYVPHPGFEKCTLIDGKWKICNVAVGDYLVVPFGNLRPAILSYRGQPMFQKGWHDWVRWMGQLKLKPTFVLSRKVRRLSGAPLEMGWICLCVTESPHVSIGCVDDGWVMDGSQVIADESCAGKVLSLRGRKSHRLRHLLIDTGGARFSVPAVDTDATSTFNIPLIAGTIRIHADPGHEKPLFLITNVQVVEASNLKSH
ncbi:MAG TPA: hypothetical protein V6C97_08925 [Oculatellaceae cyanobacterium]